ncbi:chitinase [Trichoderma gamsii]|uniref:chitinase n=1 Tax=Trichoderma gamsii TaxID=398673 RepID=A0A2P4ZW37_9HYPO|nr:chitinase [Trichoderma gamsii]PON28495.1 chitinase [Trichoderma gamsii]
MFFRNAIAVTSLLAALSSAQPSGPELAVYWGAEDDSTTLADVCADSSYGIVNLAFLDTFFAAGGFPQLSLSGLDGPSQAQQNAGATGLKDGSSLVDAIQQCQSAGKLVLLSLGGAGADVTLQSDSDGEKIADTLWNLFGGGTDNSELRPFGDIKLDGFDLDNESGNPTGYLAMVQRFKSNFQNDTSKSYFLSAAPQCPFPDASQPQDVCSELDFVWVQFYNNGDCNIAQSDFLNSVQTWSSGIGNAKLYIGALASGADGDQGFADANTLLGAIQDVKNINLPNYAGAMLWEAQLAVQNGNFQQKIAPGL